MLVANYKSFFAAWQLIWRSLLPVWSPFPFVWVAFIYSCHVCHGQGVFLYDAAFLLFISLVAIEYGWFSLDKNGFIAKLASTGFGYTNVYSFCVASWFLFISLPCMLFLSFLYGGAWAFLAASFFILIPLFWLGTFLLHGQSKRLFIYLIAFIPLQVPYFIVLQEVCLNPYVLDPWFVLSGSLLVSIGLFVLLSRAPALPSADFFSSSYWPLKLGS